MLNDGVPYAPASRKLLGASGQDECLLVNFELVMSEH